MNKYQQCIDAYKNGQITTAELVESLRVEMQRDRKAFEGKVVRAMKTLPEEIQAKIITLLGNP